MDISKTALQPTAAPSVTRAVAATASTAKQASPVTKDPAPAAKVDISNEARARLKAAGAVSSDIAQVNLKDARAVDRAVKRARTQHASGKHDGTLAKASSPSAPSKVTAPST